MPSVRVPLAAASIVLGALVGVGCAATQAAPACAKSGSGASPGGARPGGARPGGASSSGGKAGGRPAPAASASGGGARPTTPPPPAYPAGGGAPNQQERRPPPPAQSTPPAVRSRDSGAQERARTEARRPNARPPQADYDDARSSAPRRLTRGGSMTSPITGIVYVYHDPLWYHSPGHVIDLYDYYDRDNYWYRRNSPFYGRPYMLAADCDGREEHVEKPVNVTVNVDQDGKVIGEVPADPAAVAAAAAIAADPTGTAPPGSTPGTVPGSTAPQP